MMILLIHLDLVDDDTPNSPGLGDDDTPNSPGSSR